MVNHNRNIEQAICDHLELEHSCFVIEKEFWDSWVDNVSFRGNRSSFDSRSEKKEIIDNLSLIEEGHEHRLKENKNYMEAFVLVPKFVFGALSKWYPCNKVIERVVIK